MMKKIVVLISGRGSNLRAVVEARIAQAEIVAVISNKANAQGLQWAAEQGLTTHVIEHSKFIDREQFDHTLIRLIDGYQPDLVLLAGFMRILSSEFCLHYAGKLINIHPSLLPSFPGLHTHERALESGCRLAGCTIHFVTPELDCGPVIAQGAVPVFDHDTAETLAQRVLRIEHQLLPQVVNDFVSDRLEIKGNRVIRHSAAIQDEEANLLN